MNHMNIKDSNLLFLICKLNKPLEEIDENLKTFSEIGKNYGRTKKIEIS